MTSLKLFIKVEWMHKGVMSISLFHIGFKSIRLLNSYIYITSLT